MLLLSSANATDIATNKPTEVVTDTKPEIAAPSSWVQPHFFDRQNGMFRLESGLDQHWLLIERQINAATNESFYHFARQILTVSGVQNGSDLNIDFNPSYQTLTLNWARLWRGTNHLDRLETDKIRVVRQESDLDEQILNGKQTAMLVMDDVRVGDIVDYAYSIKGANPVFNDRFSAAIPIQLEEPVERLFGRVVWPAQRRFYPMIHGSFMQPSLNMKSDPIECVWDLRQVPGFHQEDSMPVWCDPEPWVQISEFKELVGSKPMGALSLFAATPQLSPELFQKRLPNGNRLQNSGTADPGSFAVCSGRNPVFRHRNRSQREQAR